jgi:hypothetical protein
VSISQIDRNTAFYIEIPLLEGPILTKVSYFIYEKINVEMAQRVLLTLLLIVICLASYAQSRIAKQRIPILSFFRMKGAAPDMRLIRNSPALSTIPFTNHSYWCAAGYTSYSHNGRVRTVHFFDATGILRETRSSISLKRDSRWRIQFSPQRSRPLIVYTLH